MGDLNLSEILAQVGISGVFVYLFYLTRKEMGEMKKEMAEKEAKKEEYMKNNSAKLIEIVENNTRVMSEISNTVDNNTQATDRLTQTVNLVLRRNK